MKIPVIVEHYMETTGQFDEARRRGIELSNGHILEEAEWQLYNAYENEGSAAYEYHPSSKAALKRFVEELRADGIVAKHDFEI